MQILDSLGMKPEERFQPDPDYNDHNSLRYRLDQQFLSFLVGLVALGLPFVLILGWRTGVFGLVPHGCFYDSISHFYYARFLGDVFVAALSFIGAFLIAYRGESWKENVLATVAGIGAFGVALFPTTGRGCEDAMFSGRGLVDFEVVSEKAPVVIEPATRLGEFFALFENADMLHFGSAAVLFGFIAFYTLFVFTREKEEDRIGGKLTIAKLWRNRIYYVSGGLILFSIFAMALKAFFGEVEFWKLYNLTFWFESLALWAFGVSWMVKGRFFRRFSSDLLLDERDKTPEMNGASPKAA